MIPKKLQNMKAAFSVKGYFQLAHQKSMKQLIILGLNKIQLEQYKLNSIRYS